jgi:hypothetical protein
MSYADFADYDKDFPDYYEAYNHKAPYQDIDFEAIDYDRVALILSDRGYLWLCKTVVQVTLFKLDRSLFFIKLRLYWNKYTFRWRKSQYDDCPF